MTPFRWKFMAGILGLSVGGLAVFADPPAADPLQSPAGSARPAASPETTLPPPPAVTGGKAPVQGAADTAAPAKPAQALDLQLPVVTPVSGSTAAPASQQPPPPAVAPTGPAAPAPLPTLPPAGPGPDAVAVPASASDLSPLEELRAPREDHMPTRQPEKAQPSFAHQPIDSPPSPVKEREPTSQPAPAPLVPAYAAPAPTTPPTVTPAPPPVPALANTSPVTTPAAPVPTPAQAAMAGKSGDKVKMLMRLGSGSPRFEIRNPNGETVLLKVACERIEMKPVAEQAGGSQLAGVTANGKVRFTGPGVEGTCDQLSVLSGTGELLLQGSIHLKTRRGKTWSELNAEKMIYQIGATGLVTSGEHRSGVTPASYRPE